MPRYVYDIEANGLLDIRDPTIHCIVAEDLDTEEVHQFPPDKVRDGLRLLYYADEVVCHNQCGYDILFIQRLYPKWEPQGTVIDTLILSKLLDPERHRHSLESYGLQFGREKPEHEDWSQFSDGMMYRCTEDTGINKILYNYLVNKAGDLEAWMPALLLEQEVSRIHSLQVLAGVDVDTEHARKVLSTIDEELESIDTELLAEIPKKCKKIGVTIDRPYKKDGSYKKAVTDYFGKELL